MEFNEFREKVKEALPDFLTDDLKNAEIKDTAVNKLQGESYSGISITPEGSRVGVSINLEDAFLDYQTGSQFTAVMNRLADTLVGTLGEREQFDLGFLADYSAVKDMLTVEVVGKDQNAEMLQFVPHQEMEDLAAVYRIDLGETENGNATVLITNEMLKNYGLTTDQPVTFSSPLYVATTDRDTFGEGVLDVPSLKMRLRNWTGTFMFCPRLCMKFCCFRIVSHLSISF